MENDKIQSKTVVCPNCHRRTEVKNPHGAQFVRLVCSNPTCGLSMKVNFSETVVKENPHRYDLPGYLKWGRKIYPLSKGRNVVGRLSDKVTVDVAIPTDDKTVSRKHCLIEAVEVNNGQMKVILSDMRDIQRITALPILLNDEVLYPEDRIVLDSEDRIVLRSVELFFYQEEPPKMEEMTLPMD